MANGTASVRINYNAVMKYARKVETDMCKKAAETTQTRVKDNIRAAGRIHTGKMIDSIRVEKTYGPNYRVIGRTPYIQAQEGGRKAIVSGTWMRDKEGKRTRKRKPMVFYWRKAGRTVRFLKVRKDPGGHFFADARDQIRLGDFV